MKLKEMFFVKFINAKNIDNSSKTDPSEDGLSEREMRKRTDTELPALIPGPRAQLSDLK